MKKKFFLFIFLGVFLFLSMQYKDPVYPPEIQKILERKKLIVAMHSRDFQPFIMKDKNGSLAGYDVELAKGMAKELGVDLEIIRDPKTFNEVAEFAALEKADMAISLLSITLSRAEKVRFSKPYLILHPTLLMNRLTVSRYLTKNPGDPVETLQKVKGLRISEPAGNSYVEIARNIFPDAVIVIKESWNDVMDAVYKGEADFAVRDEIGVKNYIFQNPEQSVQLQIFTVSDERFNDSLGIAFPAKSVHLAEWVNLYLEKYNTVKNADDLFKKYAEYYEKK